MKFNEQSNSQAALLGLQHLLAMYAGSILVPIMIASALGYNAKQLTYLIATDIFMCGIATLLQLRLSKHFGVGLPVCSSFINYWCTTRFWLYVWSFNCFRNICRFSCWHFF